MPEFEIGCYAHFTRTYTESEGRVVCIEAATKEEALEKFKGFASECYCDPLDTEEGVCEKYGVTGVHETNSENMDCTSGEFDGLTPGKYDEVGAVAPDAKEWEVSEVE